MRELYHVTLTTGHVRMSARSEVADATWPIATDLVTRMLRGETVPVPGVEPGCTLTGRGMGHCLIATVWGPPLQGDPVPLVTFGAAARARCGGRLWRMLHDDTITRVYDREQVPARRTDPDRQPPTPWLGVVLHPTIALHSVAAPWLGDLERCVAWVWIGR